MTTTALNISGSPVVTHTRLLLRLHELFKDGRGDSAEADAIRDQMEESWYAMSKQERERMSGLSEDLYALSEHSTRGVAMGPAERTAWSHEGTEAIANGNFDRALELLRRPPNNMPLAMIWFLQARCWERLSDSETALIFMRASANEERDMTVCLLSLLEQMGRREEALEVAKTLIEDPKSNYIDLYLASAPILDEVRDLKDEASRSILRTLASALDKALGLVRAIPKQERELRDAESYITCMLAHCYRRLNESNHAVEIYDAVLQRNPADAEVRTFRGIELLDEDPTQSLEDFEVAVNARTDIVWPYLVLAKHSLSQGKFHHCLGVAQAGVHKTDARELLAELYEAIGICRAELDWTPASVLQSFEKALEYDPSNQRIRRNYEMAITHLSGPALRENLTLPNRTVRTPNPAVLFRNRTSQRELTASLDLCLV